MRTDDIDGAVPPKIPRYTGRRTLKHLAKPLDRDKISLNLQKHFVWYDKHALDEQKKQLSSINAYKNRSRESDYGD